MLWLQLALAGVASGSIAALSGLGLVLTYRAAGVFNFAHGAVAMFVAYVLWQLAAGWHWPLWVAAPLVIIVVGPGIGLVLERYVFRPLETNGASTSEKLVATLGVFVVLVGLAQTIWGPVHKTDTPSLFPEKSIPLPGDLHLGANQLAQLLIVLVSGAGLYGLFRFTHIGTQIRAVVDQRRLANLSAVNANRVSALAWALGCGFAGLSGVLLAPQLELDPFRLTLLVVDTFGVAVVARLTSMPLAVVAGISMGVIQSLLTRWTPPEPWGSLKPNLLVVSLLVFLLLYKTLNERESEGAGRSLVSARLGGSRSRRSTRTRFKTVATLGLLALLVPLAITGVNLGHASAVTSLAVIFLSITAITGFTGNITLGQAGFAGLGALLTSRMTTGNLAFLPHWPTIPSMLLSSAIVAVLGGLTGYSALRRRGLFLGLTTLAVGLVLYRFIFESPFFASRVIINRPRLFGLSLDSEQAFYWFSLACLALAMFIVDRMRRGHFGRVLAAMRDSENGARSIGLDLRRYKLIIFSASAGIAAFGGSLLAQQQRGFVPLQFDPFHSFFWFTAVLVAGASYLSGSVLGASLFVILDVVLHRTGASTLVIGLLALVISRLPGGIVGLLLSLRTRSIPTPGLEEVLDDLTLDTSIPATSNTSASVPALTPFARRLLARVGAER